MTSFAPPEPALLEEELCTRVDEHRTRCLWFLRSDYYPATREQALRVLLQIERFAGLSEG